MNKLLLAARGLKAIISYFVFIILVNIVAAIFSNSTVAICIHIILACMMLPSLLFTMRDIYLKFKDLNDK
jgi:hypothetical protein